MEKANDSKNLIFALHADGLYNIRASQYEATYEVVGKEIKETWKRGINACKISVDRALVYYPDGVWELNLTNGLSKKLIESNFSDTRACVAYKGNGISFD